MNFNNLRIGTRLWLGVGSLILTLLAVIGFANWRSMSVQARADAQSAAIDAKLRIATEWANLTENNRVRTHATMISSEAIVETTLRPHMAATSKTISGLQKQLREMHLTDADKQALDRIGAARQAMLDTRKQAQALKASGQTDEALRSVEQQYVPAAQAYAEAQQAFVQLQRAESAALWKSVAEQRKATTVIVLLVGMAVLGCVLAGAYGLIRSIRLSLNEAVAVTGRIAQGDLTVNVATTRRDEFGTLMRSLHAMTEYLGTLVTQVRAATESIGTASTEIASGNQNLSARTEQTAANLQQAAASMDQLTGTVRHSADSARQANQLACSAASVAARGGEVVSQVVATMDDINASSKKIADIIGVIDGIAFQTNILALNAAVEAARAGEQGRGFAVVASEVRSLAQRSAQAAKEIKGLIGASVDKVEGGAKLVADAGQTMTEIVSSVQRVTDIIGEITAAASEQSEGIGQVNTAVVQLDQMTQQNAALVEESAAAAESLKDQAARLAGVVRTFKLLGHGAEPPAA